MNEQQIYIWKERMKHPINLVDRLEFWYKSYSLIPFCEAVTGQKVPDKLIKETGQLKLKDSQRKAIYLCTRLLKPNLIIETGVAKGASTQAFLLALHNNKKGKLYSIELPVEGFCSDGQIHRNETTAEFVDDYLKDRWELILGDSKIELPSLLNQVGNIDIFMHDSLHTYEHMKYEFDAVKYRAKYIFSDDIFWNHAFREAAGNKKFITLNSQQGVIFNEVKE